MRKMRILALILLILATSLINEVKAQKQVFEIPLEGEKIAKLKETPDKEPILVKQAPPAEAPTPQKENQEKEATISKETESNKERLQANGFKTEYYEIYKKAALIYGLDWRILAAIHKVESGQSGDTNRSSYAGAQGPMQFIPSTFRAYAVDGDTDGVAKINDVEDSIFTAANYLFRNKASHDLNHALFRYNHSQSYVNKVKSMASKI